MKNMLPKPVTIDGVLYVSIAVFTAVQTIFSSEDTYRYVNAYIIFWVKALSGIAVAGSGALKGYRSNTYSDHLNESRQKTIDDAAARSATSQPTPSTETKTTQ